jgi:hypothetical protein
MWTGITADINCEEGVNIAAAHPTQSEKNFAQQNRQSLYPACMRFLRYGSYLPFHGVLPCLIAIPRCWSLVVTTICANDYDLKPEIPIERGIKRFVDWYRCYYSISSRES